MMPRLSFHRVQTPAQIKRCEGFTLIEVMVALVIVAVALAAASRSLGVTVNNQDYLEQKVIATWVAEDAVLETLVLEQKQDKVKTVELLNREWQVRYATEPTVIPEVFKLAVEVTASGEENSSAQLFSVVGQEN